MQLAKMNSKGQITIPEKIRRKLGLMNGGNVIFLEADGKIYMENASIYALRSAQKEFEGEAEKAGLSNEEDVVRMIKELRRENTEI